MNADITGVILAGGENRRVQSRKKAFFEVGGQPLVGRVYNVLRSVFARVMIVTNTPLDFIDWNAVIVTDIFDHRSSLTGIQAALFSVDTPRAFICACDAPFLKKELVNTVVAGVEAGLDVVIPETSAGLEPLCAVYSAERCLEVIESQLVRRQFAIRHTLNRLRVKTVSEKKLRQSDPFLDSFMNVNTPEDLERAHRIISDRGNDDPVKNS
ncbi:MAG: molybdenum cofactor guanylyltransferase [Desulfosudaceae bacterium]